jgi:hypothetical protein
LVIERIWEIEERYIFSPENTFGKNSIGQVRQMSYVASIASINAPGKAHNPLFLSDMI